MLNRSIAPEYVLPSQIDLVKAQTIKLKNDTKLHVLNAGTQEVVRLEIIYQAGSKYETQSGASYFTSKMLSEGTQRKTSKEITEYLELFGAFYELHHGPDSFNVTVYSLKKYLKEVIEVIIELITIPTFPEEELGNLKNITTQSIKVNLNKTSFLASNRFKETLFGIDNPYGKVLKEEYISLIEQETLYNFFQSNIQGQPFDVVLSGNVDDDTITLIENSIGLIQVNTGVSKPVFSPISKSSTNIITVEKEDSLQSSIRLGNLTIKKDHPDYFYLVVLNEIFGGYFGSRLMKNIREEKGFTYGISSSIVHLRDHSYFVVGTDVKGENTLETLNEIEKEINLLRTQPIPMEELDTVKNYMIGSFLSSINTAFALADKFKSIYYFNLDYNFYDNYLKSIKTCNPEVLLEIANKYLSYQNLTKVVAGKTN